MEYTEIVILPGQEVWVGVARIMGMRFRNLRWNIENLYRYRSARTQLLSFFCANVYYLVSARLIIVVQLQS